MFELIIDEYFYLKVFMLYIGLTPTIGFFLAILLGKTK